MAACDWCLQPWHSRMTTSALLFREEPVERRRDERWRLRFDMRRPASCHGGRDITVLDLSASGFLFEIDNNLRIGTCIVVELSEDVLKFCKVVWRSCKFHGAQFSEPISAIELNYLLSPPSITAPPPEEDARILTKNIGTYQDRGEALDKDDSEGLPIGTRARIIAGTTLVLWSLLGGSLWLAVS